MSVFSVSLLSFIGVSLAVSTVLLSKAILNNLRSGDTDGNAGL